MPLIDVNGNPLRAKTLKQEIATPSLSGVRQILNANTLTGIDPVKLASIMRDADQGNMDAYLSMAEEIEEKDGHYMSVLGTRRRAVAQLEITVEAASDDKHDEDNADLIKEWLDRDQLEDEIFDILDAIGKGFSATEIMWEFGERWLPSDLIWRDPRWFEFDRTNGQDLLLKETGGNMPLPLYKFIVHKHKAKSGLPVRGGVIRPCSWMYLFKNFSIKDWVIFLEAYGQPIRLGKFHSGASDDEKDVLLRAVAQIGSDAAAIIPESMQIEFVEANAKGATADNFEKLARFADAQMSKAVLGQTMTTDDGSSRAQAQVHNDVRGDIERADAKQLAATLNEQLVKPIIVLNKGVQARYPRIRIGRTEDVDIDKIMTAADKGVRFGMRVSEKRLRDMTGLPEPESDDDILRIPSAPQIFSEEEKSSAQRQVAAAQKMPDDVFDDFAAALSEDWEEIMNPVAAMLEQALAESSSYEEFSQKLLEMADYLPVEGLTNKIEQANFIANIAGQLDAKFKKQEP